MTERVRRRSSKWDLKDDPDNFATVTRQDNASFGKASESIHDNGSIQSKNTGSRNSKWSDTNSNSAFMSEGNSRWSRWEPSSGNRAEDKDGNDNRDFNEVPQNMKAWDSNRSYSSSMSPGLREWRHQSHSRSPKRGLSKLHRSRSRSPPHRLRSRSRSPPHRLRSRTRSPPHGLRSRTRSPPHALKRDSEGWNDRIRGESRVPVCNDFARGRCRRGSQCKFLHQDNIGYEGRRNSGSDSIEHWGSRHDRGGSYGHPNNVERDDSRDELFHGHDSQRNNRSSDRCLNFLKGSCHRGSSCRFIHESSTDDGRGTSERTHERNIRPYSGHEHRREPYRNNSTPCKYFAVGSCRKGINCRFSHEGAVDDRPEGRSGDENKSWEGPKWSDEATDSAHGSAEGRSLNYGSSRIASTWDDPGSGRPETRSADERWGHNLGDQKKSWGGPKWGDEAAGAVNGSVEGRSVTDGRGSITDSGWGGPKWGDDAAGRANGSVEGRSLNDGRGHIANSGWGGPNWGIEVADRPEARSADEIRGHNLVDENKSWEGPKWGDEAAVPTDVGVEGSSLNDGRGHIANNGCDEATDSEVKKFPQWGNDDNGGQLGVSDENKSLGDAKWAGIESEVTKTSDWRNDINDIDVKSGTAGSRPTQNFSSDDQNRPWGVPTWTDKPSDQAVHKSPPPWTSDNNNAGMGVQLPRGHEEMLNFTNTSAGCGRDQYPHVIDNENTTFGIQDPQSQPQGIVPSHEQTSTREVSGQRHYPTVAMHPHPASTFMMHPAVSSMNAQGQQVLLSPAPRVQSFDLNGPVEDLLSPNHQRLFHMGETTKEAAGNIIDPQMSPITSGAPLTQNIVTSEQVAQISNLSASLAQIFGNSQQLPQLYATLNSTNPIGLVPPPPPNSAGLGASVGFVPPPPPNSAGVGASVGGSFVQPSQSTWSQQQYDPLNSSIESSQVGFSNMPVKQNESQIPLPSTFPPSVAGGPNGSDPAKNDSLEKTLQGNESRQVESVGNERAVAKEQNPAHSGDTNADGRVDEDGKRSKDTKGVRIFKFALVEFVKEILKPTWKEGQLSKEAHKTVVKKVVDKVTGSVQGDHIPQTQEKIDQYLAYSKNKLTKLVEAYVEKYVKS